MVTETPRLTIPTLVRFDELSKDSFVIDCVTNPAFLQFRFCLTDFYKSRHTFPKPIFE